MISPSRAPRPVAKTSAGKGHRGGRKVATRVIGADGYAVAEQLVTPADVDAAPLAAGQNERPLQIPYIVDGEVVEPLDPQAARSHHAIARAELRPEWLALDPGEPALEAAAPAAPTTEEVER